MRNNLAIRSFLASSLLTIGVACGSLTMADSATDSSPHHYVGDSAITAKVKAKLATKHLSTLARVRVDTDEKGVVWLSGRVPNQDASELAAVIAKNTDGVKSVHNNIVVEP